MSQKVKWTSDPSLAQAHAAGSKLRLVQPAVHERYGVISVAQPNYWGNYWGIHLAAADGSEKDFASWTRGSNGWRSMRPARAAQSIRFSSGDLAQRVPGNPKARISSE